VSRFTIAGLAIVAAMIGGAALRAPDSVAARSLSGPQPARPGARDAASSVQARPVVVASKPFGESYVLAEMFAQLLEARGMTVDRRPGLGSTEITFEALRTGAIDVYPEYTGTGLVAILHEAPRASAAEVFGFVARAFRERFALRWLPPLGFENTYAITVRRQTADSLGLRTLSDLARVSGRLVAGFTPDFTGRDDGLPGLTSAYGMRFASVRSLLQAIKYQALAERAVDVIDGYSTDGFIARYDLVVLEDDREFFPAYEAAALVGRELAETRPDALAALTELSGRIDVETMRRLNRRLELDRATAAEVAAAALDSLGLVRRAGATGPSRDRADVSLLRYLLDRRAITLRLTMRHLLLVGIALAIAILVAVPLGLALERTRTAESMIRAVGLLQVVPSIALLAFMIPLLGIGVAPALAALFLYALYPITRNTYSGVRNASPDAVSAAEALGMTGAQILWHVRMPLAAPVIMAGIRTAAVISVGTATLAAFIGAGGLGDPIVAGLALTDTRLVLAGAIPAALLALAVDALLGIVEHAIRPRL
jgi:osmoprotectant transport system permease protein